MSAPLLGVEGLCVEFQSGRTWMRAVDGVSFSIAPGEILGCVGESGSGKSATAAALLGLLPRRVGRVAAGAIRFAGRDLTRLREEDWLSLRGREIALVPQDPTSSLNPTMRIGRHMWLAQRGVDKRDSLAHAVRSLARMGFAEPDAALRAYPFQLSGGQRQRVLLAMALLARPKLLIADEPTTALDVTVQAEILALIETMAREDGLSVLFITHNLGVAWRLCDRIMVMRAGRIVEAGPTRDILTAPQADYTRALIAAVPGAAPPRTRLTALRTP
jgi:ABC-type dipeptide/oligopeptide/nickel transport system ATPase component